MTIPHGLTAETTADLAASMLADGDTLHHVWRYAIIQLFDDYQSDLLPERFTAEPARVREEIDAALAALVEHVARRDEWTPPAWARDTSRYSRTWWFVTPLKGLHARALQESPASFRKRGVFITGDALQRV